MDTLPSSICRACRLRLLKPSTSRAFSTTSPRSYIPPESPAFVDVPQPLQPVRDFHPRAKGILPVPRELFPARRPDKPGQQYLDNVTPDPRPENILPPEHLTETGRYKRRMAELRKTHLRSALKELHIRKTSIDASIAARSAAKQRERARLLTQTEREDVRLTNVTVPSAMRPQKIHELSVEEELATYNTRKAAHEARLAAKHEDRLDKLHTLYINSRTFITDKDQLSAAIEKAFTTTGSIWRKDGRPDTVEEMIKRGRDRTADQGRGGMMLFSDVNERALKDQERMKKIAEKLSGGKL
ncbi:uncharacterized protein Z520_08272 [Fonsecaea multimorphosa CBS 102226]|uniref:Uncharacterized protein n=1 Tax=Fonsecaea multimorphosa CBS 102226 TaxID=1442371 RepID=A0A0D2JRH5_9EURO|nr:uncharacterized protein Z520_08272 [Fonsecaea multimorphosa CBS 102226]KIX96017.1 hypothetical protein Z520_08272 [Fonsecaea multimorphosa CBS 102226]OAL21786.1 hypothetical protein AYO22_07728 [Fonsecaea multimorphosa]